MHYDSSFPTTKMYRNKTERRKEMSNDAMLIKNRFPFVTPEKPMTPKKKARIVAHKFIING